MPLYELMSLQGGDACRNLVGGKLGKFETLRAAGLGADSELQQQELRVETTF